MDQQGWRVADQIQNCDSEVGAGCVAAIALFLQGVTSKICDDHFQDTNDHWLFQLHRAYFSCCSSRFGLATLPGQDDCGFPMARWIGSARPGQHHGPGTKLRCLHTASLDYDIVVLEIIDKDRDGLGPCFGGKPETRKYLCQMPSHLFLINSGNSLNWDYLEQSPEVWRIGRGEP